jgi:ATP-dependent RNA helicase MRH4
MRQVDDVDGQATFSATVEVIPDTEYHYKFKIGQGEGERWALDEKCPVVTDEAGNQNSVLKVSNILGTDKQPPPPSHRGNTADKPGHQGPCVSSLADELEVQSNGMQPTVTNDGVAETAKQDVDTQRKPVQEKSSIPRFDELVDDDELYNIDEVLQTPLFAHESFGGYTFVDDGFDHNEASSKRPRGKASQSYALGSFDLDDASIDSFMSGKSPITDSFNKTHAGIGWGEEALGPEDFVYPSYGGSRRTSVDSADDSTLSPGSLSPTSTRRRDSRLSHSSVGRTRSAVSLGSIAEEDQQGQRRLLGGQALKPPIIAIPEPRGMISGPTIKLEQKLVKQQERVVRRD